MATDYRKADDAIARLKARQFAVTQENATEPVFDNEFWHHKAAGIYEDEAYGEYRNLFEGSIKPVEGVR